MKKEKTLWQDLIISMLSVNQYPLEKAYKHLDLLKNEGLLSHKNLAEWESTEIGNKLKKAGYDRGGITYIISDRLGFLGKFVESIGFDKFEEQISSKDNKKVEEYLLSIKGIGNKVIDNFFILRDS